MKAQGRPRVRADDGLIRSAHVAPAVIYDGAGKRIGVMDPVTRKRLASAPEKPQADVRAARVIDMYAVTGRSRLPKPLNGYMTVGRLTELASACQLVDTGSGWLIGQKPILTYVHSPRVPKDLQVGSRQAYNTLLKRPFLLSVGNVKITHQASVHAYLGSHHAGAQDAHRTAGLLGAPTDVAAGARWGSGETLAR